MQDELQPVMSRSGVPLFSVVPTAGGTKSRQSLTALLLTSLLVAGCRSTASATDPLAAGVLLREYQQSATRARQKYDGKEISVQGFAFSAATLSPNADQGSVWLQEANRASAAKVGCWFSRQQSADFSQIRSGQHLTIKGIFNGESGVELKFCRLVKVE